MPNTFSRNIYVPPYSCGECLEYSKWVTHDPLCYKTSSFKALHKSIHALLLYLDDEQKKSFQKTGGFYVRAKKSTYYLHMGGMVKIYRRIPKVENKFFFWKKVISYKEEEQPSGNACIVYKHNYSEAVYYDRMDRIPEADRLLGLKIWLENDEDHVRQVARISGAW